MEKLKTLLRQYIILTKRLFKKAGFIVILLLVPLSALAIGIISKDSDGGVISVAVAMQDNNDAIASEIVEKLLESYSLIHFERCDSPDAAKEAVENGQADAAWIFAKDLEEKIADFAYHPHKSNAFVAVIQREENILLKLSQEKLSSVIYPYMSLAAYREAAGNKLILSELSQNELDRFYSSVNADGEELFDFVYKNSLGDSDGASEESRGSLILSPLRGLFAIMILLAGIAVSMFYMQDEARGAFARLHRGTGFSFSLIYHATAVLTVSAAVLLALISTDLSIGLWRETLTLLLYSASVVGFCTCLRLVLKDIRIFGTLAPLLTVITAVLCPIFIPTPKIPIVQYLLPTYYYIKVFSNKDFAWYMLIYCVAVNLIAFLLHGIKMNKSRPA